LRKKDSIGKKMTLVKSLMRLQQRWGKAYLLPVRFRQLEMMEQRIIHHLKVVK